MAMSASALAANSTYVIAADEGYGVEDCLLGAGECGQVVADAWCEAHGAGNAIQFGRRWPPQGSHTAGVGGSDNLEIICGN